MNAQLRAFHTKYFRDCFSAEYELKNPQEFSHMFKKLLGRGQNCGISLDEVVESQLNLNDVVFFRVRPNITLQLIKIYEDMEPTNTIFIVKDNAKACYLCIN